MAIVLVIGMTNIGLVASAGADVVREGGRRGMISFLKDEYSEKAGIVSGACATSDLSGRSTGVVYLFLPRSRMDGYLIEVDETTRPAGTGGIGQLFFDGGALHIGEATGGLGERAELEATANYLLKRPLHYHRSFREAVYERPWQRCH